MRRTQSANPGRSDVAGVKVSMVDAGDLKRLARDLRKQADGKELRKELTGGLRGVLNPVRDEVKAAYRGAPAYQGVRSRSRAQQPDLRVLLAKATRVEVRTTGKLAGARVRVDGRKMPSGMRALGGYWEGYKPRWRWPVFGNREVWAQGRARPGFDRITQGHADEGLAAVNRVLDDVRRKLERGYP
jgi:hypothetical protein